MQAQLGQHAQSLGVQQQAADLSYISSIFNGSRRDRFAHFEIQDDNDHDELRRQRIQGSLSLGSRTCRTANRKLEAHARLLLDIPRRSSHP